MAVVHFSFAGAQRPDIEKTPFPGTRLLSQPFTLRRFYFHAYIDTNCAKGDLGVAWLVQAWLILDEQNANSPFRVQCPWILDMIRIDVQSSKVAKSTRRIIPFLGLGLEFQSGCNLCLWLLFQYTWSSVNLYTVRESVPSRTSCCRPLQISALFWWLKSGFFPSLQLWNRIWVGPNMPCIFHNDKRHFQKADNARVQFGKRVRTGLWSQASSTMLCIFHKW